jgi:hypothetical protein
MIVARGGRVIFSEYKEIWEVSLCLTLCFTYVSLERVEMKVKVIEK